MIQQEGNIYSPNEIWIMSIQPEQLFSSKKSTRSSALPAEPLLLPHGFLYTNTRQLSLSRQEYSPAKKILLFSAIQLLSVLAGHPEVPHPSPEERGHLCCIRADGVHRARCHPLPCHHPCSVGDTRLPLSSPVLRGFWHHTSLLLAGFPFTPGVQVLR